MLLCQLGYQAIDPETNQVLNVEHKDRSLENNLNSDLKLIQDELDEGKIEEKDFNRHDLLKAITELNFSWSTDGLWSTPFSCSKQDFSALLKEISEGFLSSPGELRGTSFSVPDEYIQSMWNVRWVES